MRLNLDPSLLLYVFLLYLSVSLIDRGREGGPFDNIPSTVSRGVPIVTNGVGLNLETSAEKYYILVICLILLVFIPTKYLI